MKKCNNYLEDNKVYNLQNVLDDFSNYFGMSFLEVENLFFDYKMIDKKLICNSIYSMEIYYYFQSYLAILSHKAIRYLMILKYIATDNNVCEEDEWYEAILKNLGIFHFGRIMSGSEINKILICLANTMNEFQSVLKFANSFDSYSYDNLDKIIDIDKLY